MKKYIVTVPDDKRALFDEMVREGHFDVYESTEPENEAPHNSAAGRDDHIPWIEAQKLIERDAR